MLQQPKIRNQAAVLGKCSDAETKCMLVWANDVRSGDPDNLEARAAVYYWKSMFGHIPGFVSVSSRMASPCFSFLSTCVIAPAWRTPRCIANE